MHQFGQLKEFHRYSVSRGPLAPDSEGAMKWRVTPLALRDIIYSLTAASVRPQRARARTLFA